MARPDINWHAMTRDHHPEVEEGCGEVKVRHPDLRSQEVYPIFLSSVVAGDESVYAC